MNPSQIPSDKTSDQYGRKRGSNFTVSPTSKPVSKRRQHVGSENLPPPYLSPISRFSSQGLQNTQPKSTLSTSNPNVTKRNYLSSTDGNILPDSPMVVSKKSAVVSSLKRSPLKSLGSNILNNSSSIQEINTGKKNDDQYVANLQTPSERRLQGVDLSTFSSYRGKKKFDQCVANLRTPSERRLHGVDLSTVSSCKGKNHTDQGVANPQTPYAKTLHCVDLSAFPSRKGKNYTDESVANPQTPSAKRLHCVDLSAVPTCKGKKKVDQVVANLQTPSTRRLQGVDLSTVSSCRGKKYEPQVSANLNSPSDNVLQDVDLSTFSSDEVPTVHTSSFSTPNENHTEVNVDNVEKMQDLRARVHVTVPRPSKLGVSLPAWMSDDILTTDNEERRIPSSSGAKKLIDSFNYAGDNATVENESNTTNAEEFVSEDDDSDLDSMRGEYISDDENDQDLGNLDNWEGYMNLGKPTETCSKCKAKMWNEERNNKSAKSQPPTFSLCCRDGLVHLPEERQPPPYLASLLDDNSSKITHFKQNIRTYNSMFAFSSIGGKIDHKINQGKAPYVFKLNGQNHHLIGSMLPSVGQPPKFCQLYIYDTENEVENRIKAIPGNDSIDPEIVENLLKMLDQENKLVKAFRMARDRFKLDEPEEFKLVLISSKAASGRPNHVGPSNEVAALLVGDTDGEGGFCDIIVETKQRFLKRIHETFVHFMQLQYPLLFPYGDDGFHLDIPLKGKPRSRSKRNDDEEADIPGESKHRTTVSMREYYAYKLMIRPGEGLTLHLGGRLWQQFVVDAFAAVEQYRLDWIRKNQKTIRSDLYKNIRDSVSKGDSNPQHIGQNVILPASFVGSNRYMNQYFRDALAICQTIGHPSLFLTMTCNTKWPEIQYMLENVGKVDVVDAPDVVARVFKLKLDQLLDLIKNKNYFGKCIGVMHVIEFQKRGLPHVHMLIWLSSRDRPNRIEQIDQLVSAEIPDKYSDPMGYAVVKNFMIHGLCGPQNLGSPCMVKDKCIRHFPKRYNGHTYFDDCGFPVYRRRRTSATVLKNKVSLDNQYVVPYNRDLLIRFRCHINLEICNNSRSLKYLFKYCLKGHDTATMILRRKKNNSTTDSNNKNKTVDEVKYYLDGRLPIHLPDEKRVPFNDDDDLQQVLERAKLKPSKLEAWFIANKIFPNAKDLTYAEFPREFTWIQKEGKWKERENGTVIGRITEVHASSGDLFYLRMLLLRKKGATSFRYLRTVNGRVYATFKEACEALGLLQNDQQ